MVSSSQDESGPTSKGEDVAHQVDALNGSDNAAMQDFIDGEPDSQQEPPPAQEKKEAEQTAQKKPLGTPQPGKPQYTVAAAPMALLDGTQLEESEDSSFFETGWFSIEASPAYQYIDQLKTRKEIPIERYVKESFMRIYPPINRRRPLTDKQSRPTVHSIVQLA
jgi:hypothetical protein